MSDKDDLADAREQFRLISEAESKIRKAWLDDMRFARLGLQWPEAVKRQREREGRPCLTINRLPSFIRQVTNDARQNKPAIVCHPVNSEAQKEVAEILNGLIRNIEYTSNADVAYDTALEHAVTGGLGYFRIATEYAHDDTFDQDLVIERIANPMSVYGDHHSTAADSSDWNVAFVVDKITNAEYEKKYGKDLTKSNWQADDDHQLWFDEDRVQIAEWWTRDEVPLKLLKLTDGTVLAEPEFLKIKEFLDGQQIAVTGERMSRTMKVRQRIMSGLEILEDNKWAGKYIPIVPVYGDEVVIDGERTFLSLIRFSKDAQQMLNYWRTASTELVALAPKAPFVGRKGAFNSDAQKWATANATSHAYIEYDGPEAPQRQAFAGPPAGALQEAMNAQDDMKSIMGIYDASLGAKSNETSGRAIMARQREGDVATFNFIDNLSRAIRHAGRILIDMIPKVYSTERIIRVINEDGTNMPVPINQPFNPQQYPIDEDQQADNAAMVKVYDLTTGKYDVTVEAGPSYTTKREEAAVQMTEFVRANPGAAPLIGDLIAKNLDWPGADEIAKRLKAMLPPQLQGQNPQVQQLQAQMQQMDAQAKQAVGQMQQQLGELQQQLQQAQSKEQAAALDKQIEAQQLQIDQYRAQTERMKIEADTLFKQMAAQSEQQSAQTQQSQIAQQQQTIIEVMAGLQQMVQQLAQPRQVVRDANGLIAQL